MLCSISPVIFKAMYFLFIIIIIIIIIFKLLLCYYYLCYAVQFKMTNKLGTNLLYFIFCLYYMFVLCHYNEQIQYNTIQYCKISFVTFQMNIKSIYM